MAKTGMIKTLLGENRINLIDVGASGGCHGRWSKLASSVRAILFEPHEEAYLALQQNNNSDDIIYNVALSDSKKPIAFNACKKQEVSSSYMPNMAFLSRFVDSDRFQVLNTVSMQADALDNVVSDFVKESADFIKIDTQGSELSILQGAEATLESVIGLEVEVEFSPMYEGQPLFADVDTFARKHGFDLIDLDRHHVKRKEYAKGPHKGQLIFADALYFKSPETLLQNPQITKTKIIKAIALYLLYGYLDFAVAMTQLAHQHGRIDASTRDKLAQLITRQGKRALPDYKGKRRLNKLLQAVTRFISEDTSPYTGNDSGLGNT